MLVLRRPTRPSGRFSLVIPWLHWRMYCGKTGHIAGGSQYLFITAGQLLLPGFCLLQWNHPGKEAVSYISHEAVIAE